MIRAGSVREIQHCLNVLLRLVNNHLQFPIEKKAPTAENLCGTYEEMYSNWKNKMTEAADRGDMYSSFMNLLSLQMMFRELAAEIALEPIDVMASFHPENLADNAVNFDQAIREYLSVYKRLHLPVREFTDIEAFIREYLSPNISGT